MSQILLLGRDGQLGQALKPQLEALGPVTALGRDQLDLVDPAAIAETVAAMRPQVIVNAAAYTAVDRAESEPDLAQKINGDAPGHLAMAAAQCGAQLIHVSTDYVFDGQQGVPRQPQDATGPLGIYGLSKLAGELAVQQALPNRHLIVRTAWVYGAAGPGNFVKTMLRLGQSRPELRVVQDQVGSPTWTGDLAAAIATLIKLGPAVPAGTYHYTNSGVASWYDFAIAIFEEAKALGLPLTVTDVQPIPTSAYPTPARRPAYSVLNCQQTTDLLGYPAPHWRQSLRTMLSQYLQESQQP